MKTIKEILQKNYDKLNQLDLELLIAHDIEKSREFVLAHPECKLNEKQIMELEQKINRRLSGEPIAYILEHREFYGLDFKVNKHTLIPRPETELLVEQVLAEVESKKQETNSHIIDIGTGSGCIIISIAKSIEKLKHNTSIFNFFGIDISKEALKVANENANSHDLNNKIKFLQGNLLNPIVQNSKLKIKNSHLIITANLPYLSDEIYNTAPKDVKDFEPKSALFSENNGLAHYEELFEQTNILLAGYNLSSFNIFIEFSPEQKDALEKLIIKHFPNGHFKFSKDLAGKWRIGKITLK